MGIQLGSFKKFMEKVSLGSPSDQDDKKGKPENFLDGMWRELGIDPNSLPEFFQAGPVHLSDEGLWFNTAVWRIIKPINKDDPFVRVKFHKSIGPNLNQTAYRKENGKMVPYVGSDLPTRVFMITPNKLSEMIGIGWSPAVQGAAAGGSLGGLL